jgi:hypothetical protein
MWEGETAVILASGPSMSQEVADKVHAAGARTIAVNSTFRLAPWADMLYGADELWWKTTPGALEFAGLRVSCSPGIPGTRLLCNLGSVGYSDDASSLFSYGNSGGQAVQIAAKAGATRILLCGFDMHGGHWHGDHQPPLRNNEDGLYARWITQMATLAAALSSRGVTVWNCTPTSALRCWPFVSLEDALVTEPA